MNSHKFEVRDGNFYCVVCCEDEEGNMSLCEVFRIVMLDACHLKNGKKRSRKGKLEFIG